MAKDSKPHPKNEDSDGRVLRSELWLFENLKIFLSNIKTFHYRPNMSASTIKINKIKISYFIM
jgi:hypothetical protein